MNSLLVMGLASGCGPVASSSAHVAKPLIVKFALFSSATFPQTAAAQRLAQLVKQATHGHVLIRPYLLGNQQSARAILKGLETGSTQMSVTTAATSLVPASEVFYLPYLFPSEQAAMKVANGPVGQQVWRQFTRYHLHVIGVWPLGYADFLTTKKITSLSSLHGLKLSVFDAPMGDWTDRALGANPTPIPVEQVFATFAVCTCESFTVTPIPVKQELTALQMHAIDGMDGSIGLLVAEKDYQAAHYLAITHHFFILDPILVSNSFWEQLTPTERQAVIAAERATEPYEWHLIQVQARAGLKTMAKAGVVITHPHLQAFKRATQPVYKQIVPIVGTKLMKAIHQAL